MKTTEEEEILRIKWDIKHELWFLHNRMKELQHLEETIKQSKERLKKFNDELNTLKQK